MEIIASNKYDAQNERTAIGSTHVVAIIYV